MLMSLLTNATKSYEAHGHSRVVFSDLSVSAKENAINIIMAPNASGKSTLMRVLMGMEVIDKGTVNLELDSKDRLGIVIQDYRKQLLSWTSIKNNIIISIDEDKRSYEDYENISVKIQLILDGLNYNISRNAVISSLSGGHQQAFVIARALTLGSSIFLWDEPMSAIDYGRKKFLYKHLLQRDHGTIIMVTHNVDEAIILGDRIIVYDANMREIDVIPVNINKQSLDDMVFTKEAMNIRRRIWEAMYRGEERL
jgi:ABC-type nitrate/sulfonate/bicarbonate transport system ATPase subunit